MAEEAVQEDEVVKEAKGELEEGVAKAVGEGISPSTIPRISRD
jgi:hypothetical protein